MKISLDGLEQAISNELKIYADEVKEALEESQGEIAKEGVKTLKRTSPKGKSKKKYSTGWATKKETERTGTTTIIYNKNKPGLTHLLEKGHAKRGGGRVAGIEHIAPVEAEIIKKYEEAIKKAVQ